MRLFYAPSSSRRVARLSVCPSSYQMEESQRDTRSRSPTAEWTIIFPLGKLVAKFPSKELRAQPKTSNSADQIYGQYSCGSN